VIPLLLRGGIDEDRTERKDIFLTLLFHAVVKGLLLVRGHRRRRCHLLLLDAASRNANQGADYEYHASLHVITSEHIVLCLAEGAHQPLSEDGSNAFDESRGEIFSNVRRISVAICTSC